MRHLLMFHFFFLIASSVSAREIALSFDDAPRPDGQYFKGSKRATLLISQLSKAKVRSVFFCTTKHFTTEGQKRIRRYARAGHFIANHTHHHWDLHVTDPKLYAEDITKAHHLLSGFPNFRHWFRYPFLREGNTTEKRDLIRSALKDTGYRNGYVTVDNYDWYMDRLFQDALTAKKQVHFEALRRLYVKVLTEDVEFYDQIAVATLGRSPRHVLLLHENDLAALFIGSLISELRERGWTIISPERAYEDPIGASEPDTLFLGQGRVAAIAKIKGYPGPFWKWEEEADLDRLFKAENVFE